MPDHQRDHSVRQLNLATSPTIERAVAGRARTHPLRTDAVGVDAQATPTPARTRAIRIAYRACARRACAEQPAATADVARRIGITEGELVAAHCGVFDRRESPMKSRRLRAEWSPLLDALDRLGNVRCTAAGPGWAWSGRGPSGPSDVVRVNVEHLAHGFAVEERRCGGLVARSVRFFARDGRAILSVGLPCAGTTCAFYDLVKRFATHELSAGITVAGVHSVGCDGLPADAASLCSAWSSLRLAGDTAPMLRRLAISELQAVRLLHGTYALPLPVESAQELLARASAVGLNVMAQTENQGACVAAPMRVECVDVHDGQVTACGDAQVVQWHESRIDGAWLVMTPSRQGLRHTVVLFDAEGNACLRLNGDGLPGRAARCAWRELVLSLAGEPGTSPRSVVRGCPALPC